MRTGRAGRASGVGLGISILAMAAVAGCGSAAPVDPIVAEASAFVADEAGKTEGWTGPESGPASVGARRIVFIPADASNGGISAVAEGARRAAEAIGWTFEIIGGEASPDARAAALEAALAGGPDGLIIGGFDAAEQQAALAAADAKGIPVVGWHAASKAGADAAPGLFTNVTTNPLQVAKMAADFVIADSGGKAGVVIFFDGQYGIAVDKAEAMRDEIRLCTGCTVLAMEDVAIADAYAAVPPVLERLEATHGEAITHLLAINGNYFAGSRAHLIDKAVPGKAAPYAVAAGDGDEAEFRRIRDRDYQRASVAEPLYLQGWQLVDELNRAFAGEAPSSYIAPPGLITTGNVPAGAVFDPPTDYEGAYERIWNR